MKGVDDESICPVCGALFVKTKRNQLYCSPDCRERAEYQRAKGRGKEPYPFESQRCVICGKPFMPRTTLQKTCGGHCTLVYMHRYHGKRDPDISEDDKKNRAAYGEEESLYDSYETSLLEWLEMSKTSMPDKYFVETSKRFLDSLEPSLGQSANRMQLAQTALNTAKELDRALPKWRDLARHRQEALLDLAVGIGARRFLGDTEIINAIKYQDWQSFKSHILCLAWAQANGHRAVKMCRKLILDFGY